MSIGAILLAEDDLLLSELIVAALTNEGFFVEAFADGSAAVQRAISRPYALLILDRQLPGLDGLHLLQRVRSQGVATPAIFLTALGDVKERVRGLDAGADDYLVKPINVEELIARVRAIIRRPPLLSAEQFRYGRLNIDLGQWRASFDGSPINLSAQEMLLLSIFLRRPSQVFTRENLLDQLNAAEDVGPAAIEHAISRLRKKIEAAGAPEIIDTVRGIGYRLRATSRA